MPSIPYIAEGFPVGGPVANAESLADISWDDLLWSALTVGRPNLHCVFKHGAASGYEALFRLSLVRMALEQFGPQARRFRRTSAAKSLDPSEKGAVNYFLGMTCCKLFAAKFLDTPWLLHVDVFADQLGARFFSGRSRPDLVGQSDGGQWLAFESKGRVSAASQTAKQKAKLQSLRLKSVGGVQIAYHLAGISFFAGDVLRFYWCDPEPEEPSENTVDLGMEDRFWRFYYEPSLQFTGQAAGESTRSEMASATDVDVKIHPEVLRFLLVERWGEARQWCIEHGADLAPTYRRDGLRVTAGPSWPIAISQR